MKRNNLYDLEKKRKSKRNYCISIICNLTLTIKLKTF